MVSASLNMEGSLTSSGVCGVSASPSSIVARLAPPNIVMGLSEVVPLSGMVTLPDIMVLRDIIVLPGIMEALVGIMPIGIGIMGLKSAWPLGVGLLYSLRCCSQDLA